MSRRTADTPPARPPRAPIPDISRPDPATQETTPEHTDTLHADPARFFKPSYTQELRNLIGRIAEHHAPLLLSELADQVAHAHGWPHADGRIKDRVQRNLRQVEVHLEYGSKLFVWPQGQYADRAPFKGLNGRRVVEISQTEIASVVDAHRNVLTLADDPPTALSHLLGMERPDKSTHSYLAVCIQWAKSTRPPPGLDSPIPPSRRRR